MEFLGRLIRFLFWVILLSWIVRRISIWVGSLRASRRKQVPPTAASQTLHRDPWCGTYVAPQVSHTLEQAGQTLHFCSAECRGRYLDSQRRAVRA